LFRDHLIKENVLDEAKAGELENSFKQDLQKALDSVPEAKAPAAEPKPLVDTAISSVKTAVDAKTLVSLSERMYTVPPEFRVHPKIQRHLEERLEMFRGDPNKACFDWGVGEMLAYASLLCENVHVRISGQDVRRGTFSHRHAVWVDQV